MNPTSELQVTVSGSFHRHLGAIFDAVQELRDRGVNVLSPADPRVIDQIGDFLFVASDKVRSIRLVEDRHLDSIRASSFLWIVAPDGYVGLSTALEIGVAIEQDIPVFCTSQMQDLTLDKYVHTVPTLNHAVAAAKSMQTAKSRFQSFLVDPHGSVEASHRLLDEIRTAVTDHSSARLLLDHRPVLEKADQIRAHLPAKGLVVPSRDRHLFSPE